MVKRVILVLFAVCACASAQGRYWDAYDAAARAIPTGGGAQLWTPAELTLSGWFDAKATNQLWRDINATQPATNGSVVIRWGNIAVATEWMYALSGSNAAPIYQDGWLVFNGTKFLAGSYLQYYITASNYFVFSTSQITNATRNSSTFWLNDAIYSDENAYMGAYVRTNGVLYALNYAGTNNVITTNYTLGQGLITYAGKTPTTMEFATDGKVKQEIESGSNTYNFESGTYRLRFGASVGARYMQGRIGEIITGKTVISTADRQRVEGYLAHKWGLTANLPADHPYKSAAPTK